MTPTIDAGENIQVAIEVKNYKENLTDVVITDIIPDGVSVVTSANDDFEINGNKISFQVGEILENGVISVSYQLATKEVQSPDFQLYDNFEGPLGFDREKSDNSLASWNVTTVKSAGGIFSLRMIGDTLTGESYAINKDAIFISDENKLLKFIHRFGTELGIDGGVVEISKDDGASWDLVTDKDFLVNGYNDVITFDNRYQVTSPAFTGENTDWNPTVIDLSKYTGESIFVRFRYIQRRFLVSEISEGWLIDNFEIYERKELSGTAELLSGATSIALSTASTYVNSDARRTPTKEVEIKKQYISLSPNPTSERLNILFIAQRRSSLSYSITNTNGQVVESADINVKKGENTFETDLSSLPAGIYTIEFVTNAGREVLQFAVVK